MKSFIVISDFSDKETGQIVRSGAIYEADEDREAVLRSAGVIGKEANLAINQDQDHPTEPLTADQFAELAAGEQKDLLKKLEIEGEDGNKEQRVALYAAYLEGTGGGE